MRKRISIIYGVCVCIAFIFLVYMAMYARNERFGARRAVGYTVLEDHVYTQRENADAPIGIEEVYEIGPEEIPSGSRFLVFQTVHQEVEVSIGEELVASIHRDRASSVGKTPGNCWVSIPFYDKDQGKGVRVVIRPVYKSAAGVVPDLYLGSQHEIYMSIVKRDLTAILLSIVAILLGLGFMAFSIYNRRNPEVDHSLFMMGQFAVMIGMWKMSDTGTMALYLGHEEILSYVTLLSLLLVVVPFMQYVRALFSNPGHWTWNVPCVLSIAVFFISMGLQIFRIYDLREVLGLNHLSMLLMVAVIFPMLFYEVRKVGWNRKLKNMVICMGACLIGMGADIIIYYASNRVSVTNLGMIGFLVYITVLGIMSLQDAKQLMKIGMQAKHFEQMAFHDQLTGLYNRAAYADDTGREDFVPNILIMLDLNDLKHCNDTYGHEKGDLYITTSAGMIQQVFGKAGRCYRMGGDEFCILLRHSSVKSCEAMVRELKQKTDVWNREHDEKFLIQIATGYAVYDASMDYDIGDTLRRADKMMYREKYEMKHCKERSS